MIFRDHIKKSQGSGYSYVLVHLPHHTLYFESWGDNLDDWSGWLIPSTWDQRACLEPQDNELKLFDHLGEFETQMMLDHYIVEHGLLQEVQENA